MRPRSACRLELHAALIDGGGTTRMLAQRIGQPVPVVCKVLDNMAAAGEVHTPRQVRVPGINLGRPVPWYERAPLDAANDDDDGQEQPLIALANAWRSPAAVRGAMGPAAGHSLEADRM